MMFGTGDPWLPTLLDVERFKAEGIRPEYWQKFGWDQLVVPDECIIVKQRFETLGIRFVAKFGWRMLAFETMEQWQTKLQERMDAIVRKYERAYETYEGNLDDIRKVAPGEVKRTVGKISASGEDVTTTGGSDGVTTKSKYSDTPDSAINDSDNFAGSITKDESKTTYGATNTLKHGRSDNTDMTATTTRTGAELMESINGSIDAWRDLDTAFVSEFNVCFLNLFWA